jgi:ubiquinone/menaquinone biosynthesis C-methylase UbiE
MPVLQKMKSRVCAQVFPPLIDYLETHGQAEIRHRLLADAYGRTLEIGTGSGENLKHYSSAVTELIATDHSPLMLRILRDKLTASPPSVGSWRLEQMGAERLPYPDDSFDTVVATYVQCAVPDPLASMHEINRVLRPGGQYLFLEHVRSPKGTVYGSLQDLVAWPHTWIFDGCYPNRDFERTLRDSPLAVEVLEHGSMPVVQFAVKPIILGKACAAAAATVEEGLDNEQNE